MARNNVEIIVVIDRDGKFVGAGTQNLPAAVDFPPALMEQLKQPNANFTIHHNHPPDEEPFFSNTDMRGLANNPGIGWMLMHNAEGYAAMRAADRMFAPDAAGNMPVDGLPAAYQNAQRLAQFTIFKKGLMQGHDVTESGGPTLALHALHQAGAIEYYSSLRTGLSHEQERSIIQHIRDESLAKSGQFGGPAIWSRTESAAVPAASGRESGADRNPALSHPSPLETGFDRFVAVLSRQNTAPHAGRSTGRPPSSPFSETGGDDSDLASGPEARRPLLETGLGTRHLSRA